MHQIGEITYQYTITAHEKNNTFLNKKSVIESQPMFTLLKQNKR